MSNIPADLRFAKSHEWVKLAADGTALVGITDYAQNSLGDITFIQLPKVGAALKAGETFGVVESVKAASDIYMPIGGTITEVNNALEEEPELINTDPYGKGWLIKFTVKSVAEAAGLMDAAAYTTYCESR
jgi:glycine cleavage system H protein